MRRRSASNVAAWKQKNEFFHQKIEHGGCSAASLKITMDERAGRGNTRRNRMPRQARHDRCVFLNAVEMARQKRKMTPLKAGSSFVFYYAGVDAG